MRLTPVHEILVQALTVDARRPKKEWRTAWMLFEEIQAAGYEGCYSRVTDFVRAWRHSQGKAVATSALMLLHFGEVQERFRQAFLSGIAHAGFRSHLSGAAGELAGCDPFRQNTASILINRLLLDAACEIFEHPLTSSASAARPTCTCDVEPTNERRPTLLCGAAAVATRVAPRPRGTKRYHP